MFTIDLLKGQGVPIRSQPQGIVLGLIIIAAPLLMTVIGLSYYFNSRVTIGVQTREIAVCRKEIDKLGDVVESQKQLNSEKQDLNNSLNDVASALTRYTQWTPILINIVQNIPDSLILTGLEVKRNSARVVVPRKDDPTKTTNVTVPKRSLHMTVCGGLQNDCSKAVREFSDRLRFSDILGDKLEDIKFEQSIQKSGDQEVVTYRIDCFFKPKV